MAESNGQVAARTQSKRQFAVFSPLGEDVLLFRRMSVREELGRLTEIDLDIITESADVDPAKLLGKNVTVRVELPATEGTRYFNGYVNRLRHESPRGGLERWNLTIVPWLWFLTRTSDCRIFQEKSVPDIVLEVIKDYGFTDIDNQCTASYPTREYVVQYRETAFDFVSRLMEEEGIYYYFKHEDGKHTLVLIDDAVSHQPFDGYAQIPFRDVSDPLAQAEKITELRIDREIQPGAQVLTDYDFTKPKSLLEGKSATARSHENATFELFDHPGGFSDSAEGERYAGVRLHERQWHYEVLTATGDARGAACGSTFKLAEHPTTPLNKDYLTVASVIRAEADAYGSEGTGDGRQDIEASYEIDIRAIDAKEQFRPARQTRTPTIPGPQTAVVVGPSGEEIHTDAHGRIKVMFHWDRYAPADGTDSCWIRVSQPTAGKGWGYMSLPRIGQEVIVEFLNGDPDRPIVTGRVYNGANKVPYELPGNKTRTTFKSNSSPKGGGFNEIRFEDKKDEENVFIHAQKDFDLRAQNDRFETIMNDRHLVVDNDRREHIKNDSHHFIDNDHFTEIGNDENVLIKGKEARKVEKDHSEVVMGAHAQEVKKGMSIVVGKDLYIKAKNICIEAETNLTIISGQSSVALEGSGAGIAAPKIKIEAKSGDIETKAAMNHKTEAGMNLEAKGGMNTKVEGGMNTEIKGGINAKVTGVMAEVSGSAMAKLKGGITMIG